MKNPTIALNAQFLKYKDLLFTTFEKRRKIIGKK